MMQRLCNFAGKARELEHLEGWLGLYDLRAILLVRRRPARASQYELVGGGIDNVSEAGLYRCISGDEEDETGKMVAMCEAD